MANMKNITHTITITFAVMGEIKIVARIIDKVASLLEKMGIQSMSIEHDMDYERELKEN